MKILPICFVEYYGLGMRSGYFRVVSEKSARFILVFEDLSCTPSWITWKHRWIRVMRVAQCWLRMLLFQFEKLGRSIVAFQSLEYGLIDLVLMFTAGVSTGSI